MNEKRFFNSYFTEHIIDKKTDKCYPVRYVEGVYELTDLLNDLAEENEQLRFLIDINSVSERKKLERQVDEQQATINELTKNRDRWRELAKLHNGYFNCLEKAIEKAYEEKPYPKIEDIMDIYSELEKEFEDE